MTSTNHQAPGGAITYQKLSSQNQMQTFEKLLSNINIEEGWKILDFGCGTGNGTALLADIVGPKGYVYGIDPFIERIEVAKHNYKRENLEFIVGYAKDSPTYGTDFDLVTSSYVMHWLSYNEKLVAFKKVWECLKIGGAGFHFVTTNGKNLKFLRLFEFLPKVLTQKFIDENFFESCQSYKKMALDNRFDEVSYKEVLIESPFISLDEFFKWLAATLHNNDYETFLKHLREIPEKHDISFMYNDKGDVVKRHVAVFVTCKKCL